MVIVSCQIHGLVFTRFTFLSEKPPDGYTWSGERLTRKQTTSRPDKLWPEIWKHMSDASKRKDKSKCTIEKPKLDNARKSRGIYFTVPDDEEFEEFMENARRQLENPMPAAVPCKTSLCRSSRETCRAIGGHKTKYVFIVEADESMRIRLERAPHRDHEDHIAGKGLNSLSHNNLVRKFIPMPQAMKIPDAKAALEKIGKLEKIPAWQLTKVRNKNGPIAEARHVCRNRTFCVINGSLSS